MGMKITSSVGNLMKMWNVTNDPRVKLVRNVAACGWGVWRQGVDRQLELS